MKKLVFLVIAVLLVSLIVIGGCAQPAVPGETTKTVTTTVTAAAKTVTAPAKTVTTTKTVTAGVEEPKVIEWTMQAQMEDVPATDHWARPESLHQNMFHEPNDWGWAQWITDRTNGRLKINVVSPNAIFPNHEAVENVGGGVVDMAATAQGWIAGTIPECYVGTGMSMMWPDARYVFDCYYNYGLLDKFQPVFAEHNIYMIPTFNAEVGGIGATFDCTDMASIEGRKIRFFGAHGILIEALGGLPVSLPYADVYMGLKLGTIEGTTTGALALENIKLKEVLKGWASMGLYGCTVNAQLYNMDSLNALPDDIKQIVVESTPEYLASTVAMTELLQQKIAIAAAVEDYGMQHWVWAADEQAAARTLASEVVWPQYGEKSALSQEMLDIVIEYLKIFGLM